MRARPRALLHRIHKTDAGLGRAVDHIPTHRRRTVLERAANADIEPDTVHHRVIARPDGRHGAVVGSGLSFAHSPLWPACRSPLGDDAADRTVVQTKESGELGVSKLTGISRLEDGLVS